jgi:FdrA protein
VAGVLAGRRGGPLIIASVTGTEGDPQPRAAQVRKLIDVGVTVADSNADATEAAIAALGARQSDIVGP